MRFQIVGIITLIEISNEHVNTATFHITFESTSKDTVGKSWKYIQKVNETSPTENVCLTLKSINVFLDDIDHTNLAARNIGSLLT